MLCPDYRLQERKALEEDDCFLAEAVVEPIWFLPSPRDDSAEKGAPWASVTKGQLLIFAAIWVERELLNGGFAQYFSNTTGSFYGDALEGFRVVGEQEYADLLVEAGRHLSGGTPSPIRAERMALIGKLARDQRSQGNGVDEEEDITVVNDFVFEDLNRKFYDSYGDGSEYYAAMARYIRSHPDEFFR
jgi:hypothetical protein